MKGSSVEVGRRADQLLEAVIKLEEIVPPSWAETAGPAEVAIRGLVRKIRQQAEILAGRARTAREIDAALEAGDRPTVPPGEARSDDPIHVGGTGFYHPGTQPAELRNNHDSCVECGKLVGTNRDCENCRRVDDQREAGDVPAHFRGPGQVVICPPRRPGKLFAPAAGEPVSRVPGDQVPDARIEPRKPEEATPASKRDSPSAAVGRMALEVGDLRRELVQEIRISRTRAGILAAILRDFRNLLEGSELLVSQAAAKEVPVAGMEPRTPDGRDQAAVRAGVSPP